MHNWDCNNSERCGYNVTAVKQNDDMSCVLELTHETPTKHYVDNIVFTLAADADDNTQYTSCAGTADSKSEPLSIGDYGTNYCNIYNLLLAAADEGVKYDKFETSKSKCTNYVEGTMPATCDKY
jgi:hypothetical protein